MDYLSRAGVVGKAKKVSLWKAEVVWSKIPPSEVTLPGWRRLGKKKVFSSADKNLSSEPDAGCLGWYMNGGVSLSGEASQRLSYGPWMCFLIRVVSSAWANLVGGLKFTYKGGFNLSHGFDRRDSKRGVIRWQMSLRCQSRDPNTGNRLALTKQLTSFILRFIPKLLCIHMN